MLTGSGNIGLTPRSKCRQGGTDAEDPERRQNRPPGGASAAKLHKAIFVSFFWLAGLEAANLDQTERRPAKLNAPRACSSVVEGAGRWNWNWNWTGT